MSETAAVDDLWERPATHTQNVVGEPWRFDGHMSETREGFDVIHTSRGRLVVSVSTSIDCDLVEGEVYTVVSDGIDFDPNRDFGRDRKRQYAVVEAHD
jgi:hypothetical protein